MFVSKLIRAPQHLDFPIISLSSFLSIFRSILCTFVPAMNDSRNVHHLYVHTSILKLIGKVDYFVAQGVELAADKENFLRESRWGIVVWR